MDVILGAYPASPTLFDWDPALESEFLDGVEHIPEVSGLEIPWAGSLHAHDETWPLTRIPSRLRLVVTDVPFAVKSRLTDPSTGLASRDEAGRQRSLATARALRDDVQRLVEARGTGNVLAVELHSAPLRRQGSPAALADSLAEIATWDWGGASLLIEHCDAEVPGHEPQKGFLLLDEEIEAIAASGAAVGIALNWGRSAIELRDPDAVLDHVRAARDAGLLRAVIFSGAADRESAFGAPWLDAHLPFARSTSVPDGDPDSLLTEERIRTVLAEGAPTWVGAKVGWPRDGSPAAPRLRMLADSARLLARATESLPA